MKLHRNQNYYKWGLTALIVFVVCAILWLILSNLTGSFAVIEDLTSILSPIVYGCAFAYLMNPIMLLAQKLLTWLLGKTKLPQKWQDRIIKTGSVVSALVVFLAALVALLALIVPSIIESLEELLQPSRIEGYYQTITQWLDNLAEGNEIEVWLYSNVDKLLQVVTDWLLGIDVGALISGLTASVYNIVSTAFNMFIGIVAAVYILVYKKRLCAQAKKFTTALFNHDHANRLFDVARRADRIFGGFVIGKIIDALFVAVVTYITMWILGMPYRELISTIIGVTNIIPFFGPFLGWVPSMLLLLINEPMDALYFTIFVVVLQAIDGNIIENRILGEKLGISDLWVLVAILLFGGVFGFTGMLLGVPVFALLYSLIADFVNGRLQKKRYPTETEIYYTIQCVEDLPVEPLPTYSFDSIEPAYDLKAEPEDDFDEPEYYEK